MGQWTKGRFRASSVYALLLVVAIAFLISVPVSPPGSLPTFAPIAPEAAPGLNFDYVVTVIMENHNLCDIYAHCGGSAQYMTSLADAYSISLNYHYANTNPSLPNYLALSGGTTFGCTSNTNPNTGCATAAWNAPNIVDRVLAAGLTFKAYMESMPSNCTGSDSGPYAVRHDPFVYYNDIVSNSTRCDRVVPAGTAGSALLTDLLSTSTASNYMWMTPDVCNDMHDCTIAVGDAYLSVLVPAILATPVFATERAALFVVFDEGYGNPTYAAWTGPVVKTNYTSSTYYDAYSVLKTIESNWNLPPLTGNDGNATSMDEFFATPAGPDFSLSASPRSVSFLEGQSANSTVSLHPTGGFNGSVDLSGSSAPAGVTTGCVPSALQGNESSVCTMSSSTGGSYTVTVTGTNGTLRRSVAIAVTVIAPDFALSANPATVSFVIGESSVSTVTLQSTGGFTGTVALTTTSAPPGVDTSCAPSNLTGSQTSTCRLTGTTPGSFTVTVTGTNGTLRRSVAIAVTVTAPDFSLSANPAMVSFVVTESSDSTLTLQSTGGFMGTVALTTASSPAGVDTSCAPSNLTGSQASTCTLTGTTPGSFTVTVTGTNGTLVHTTSIDVTVLPAGPTARFTYSPAAPVANSSVLFDASSSSDADPGATLQARWDWDGDGVWDTALSASLAAQHIFTAPGTYSVKLEIHDSHGLIDSTSQSVSAARSGIGDKTPPQVLITSPGNASVVTTENVTVTGIASDNVAIKSVELSTDNETWTPVSGTRYWSGNVTIANGTNTIYARATDTAGNKKTVKIIVTAEIPEGGPPSPPPATDATTPPFPFLQLSLIAFVGAASEIGLFLGYRKMKGKKPRDEESAGPPSP